MYGQKPVCSSCRIREETCSYPPARPSPASAAAARPPFAWCQPYLPTSPFYSYLAPSSLQLNPGLVQTLSELTTLNHDQLPFYSAASMATPGTATTTTASSSSSESPPAASSITNYSGFNSSMPSEESSMLAFNSVPGQVETWMASPIVMNDLSSTNSLSSTSLLDDYTNTTQSQSCQSLFQTSLGGGVSWNKSENTSLSSSHLPPSKRMEELLDVFFQRFYVFLPIFHRKRLASTIATPSGSDSLLLFSVFALVAGNHPDPYLQSLQVFWFDKAKALYSSTTYQPDEPLQTLQAAACLILHAMIIGDHSTAWLVLGKAWRQAVALGFHQTDSGAPSTMPSASGVASPSFLTDWREMEEKRRTMWTLFMLDRGMCFPIGLAHSIDERQLRINLPMDEVTFQNGDSTPEASATVLFTTNFRRLLTLARQATNHSRVNMAHYIILSYMLLGRVVEHVYSADTDMDDQQHNSKHEELQEDLSQFRLMLPRSATNLAHAAYADSNLVVWLNVLINVIAIFVFHRPQKPASDDEPDSGPNWQNCVAVARSTTMLIREASRVSTDLLINPSIAAPAFTCARILIIEHLLSSPQPSTLCESTSNSKQSALEADLQVLLLMFDRLSEAFSGVGAKFRNGVAYHLKQGQDNARKMKAVGSKELITSCGKWPSLNEVSSA